MDDTPSREAQLRSVNTFRLHRRRESVTAVEILDWIAKQPDTLGWLATENGVKRALKEICS